MDGRTHSRAFTRSLLFFIPLLIYLGQYLFIPLLFLSNSIVDSDEDNKWRGGGHHRYFLTHSILWPLCISLVFWLPIYNVQGIAFTRYLFVLCSPIVIHLFLDLFTPVTTDGKTRWTWARDPKGKYRIQLKKGKRLSAGYSRLWLIGNIIIGLLLMILFL